MDHAVSLASSETQGSAYKIPASSLGESLFLQRDRAPNVNFRKISQCSEDDLRSRIFGTFVVKFSLACLS